MDYAFFEADIRIKVRDSKKAVEKFNAQISRDNNGYNYGYGAAYKLGHTIPLRAEVVLDNEIRLVNLWPDDNVCVDTEALAHLIQKRYPQAKGRMVNIAIHGSECGGDAVYFSPTSYKYKHLLEDEN